MSSTLYAPGARVVIRDCEWIVRRADPSDDGGYILTVDGLSELVNGKSARFLTCLEEEADAIQVLDPAETRFEQDMSPGFEKSRLFIEAQLRQITPADQRIHLGHKAAMDPVPYQLDPALQALNQHRQRILIADAVGLGKTLEAGILMTELMRRGRGKRILVLTLKSMMTQFQKEMWNRFTIPLTRLDSQGLQRVRNNIPGNHNPFYYYDKSIISIDTLKQDNEYRRHLERAYWDIIVIDECHNVAERGSSSQRAKLAQLLAGRSDTLVMLSATPHDGKARSFASLMNMLDPTAISDPDDYAKDDFSDKGLVIRRFKKDIRDQVQQEFRERVVKDIYMGASPEEEATYQALLDVPFTYRGEHSQTKNGQLVRIGLQKAIFSSPAAADVSVQQRIAKLEKKAQVSEDERREIQSLKSLALALRNVTPAAFNKYQSLLKLLKSSDFGWKKTDSEDRLVIFSERIETLKWLNDQLADDMKLKAGAVQILHGGMSDVEQQSIVEEFGKPESKLRVLLCSDVASEGINLHYLSHRLVHFDLPWSLMVFQQRNGRVDRYGQEKPPIITYLINQSDNPIVKGDQRILEILKEKDEQAYKNIGDPATFMKVHDSEQEEKLTEDAMADGMEATAFDQQYQPDDSNEGDDLLALFLNPEASQPNPPEQTEQHTVDDYSLFANDYDFAREALDAINRERNQVSVSANNERQTLTITPPDDLKYRFRFLPPEISPDNGLLELTADKARFEQEIRRSRQDENAWPKLHYLWPQHPAIQWLQDKLLAQVARHSAPVLALPDADAVKQQLQPEESVFLVSGLIPNRKAHPVIWEWFAVRCHGGAVTEVLPARDWLQPLQLDSKLPNRAQPVSLTELEALRQPVINATRTEMQRRQQAFTEATQPTLDEKLAELAALKARQVTQLDLQLQGSQQAEHFKAAKREERLSRIDRVFNDYQTWVSDTLTIEPVPYIQIIAAFTRAHG
ncbi:MAG: DEAD/DEAH box helicase [Pseudomonadota bacterium]|uniref:DEAD/DEAH box helicase n=1 Tax=Marinobacter salarius TaxID=1420917 RepID=UPI00242035B3|nr:DEAD/DEAH box helicase [Marinobacter salarius]MEA3260605.1 DEAD/DEAH box helicase [Pseudomonadota bacterium]|tara:strand:+ start:1489 stop:4392 length:2904 start_codon:yes stop_codon:yes gene_type:complete